MKKLFFSGHICYRLLLIGVCLRKLAVNCDFMFQKYLLFSLLKMYLIKIYIFFTKKFINNTQNDGKFGV